MDWNKLPKVGTFTLMWGRTLWVKKVSGSVIIFLVLYVDDILLIGNDIPTMQIKYKDLVIKIVLHERLRRDNLYSRNKGL